jgi:hypothetical protein
MARTGFRLVILVQGMPPATELSGMDIDLVGPSAVEVRELWQSPDRRCGARVASEAVSQPHVVQCRSDTEARKCLPLPVSQFYRDPYECSLSRPAKLTKRGLEMLKEILEAADCPPKPPSDEWRDATFIRCSDRGWRSSHAKVLVQGVMGRSEVAATPANPTTADPAPGVELMAVSVAGEPATRYGKPVQMEFLASAPDQPIFLVDITDQELQRRQCQARVRVQFPSAQGGAPA